MSLFLRVIAPAILLTIVRAAVAGASTIRWDLQGVAFTDQASAAGFFSIDADLSRIVDWDIATTQSVIPSVGLFGGYSYTPTTSVAIANSSGCGAAFIALDDPAQFLCLNYDTFLVAGATPSLLSTSNESYPSGLRFVSGGTLSDPCGDPGCAVPEPATLSLLASGMVAAVCRLRRRRIPWANSTRVI